MLYHNSNCKKNDCSIPPVGYDTPFIPFYLIGRLREQRGAKSVWGANPSRATLFVVCLPNAAIEWRSFPCSSVPSAKAARSLLAAPTVGGGGRIDPSVRPYALADTLTYSFGRLHSEQPSSRCDGSGQGKPTSASSFNLRYYYCYWHSSVANSNVISPPASWHCHQWCSWILVLGAKSSRLFFRRHRLHFLHHFLSYASIHVACKPTVRRPHDSISIIPPAIPDPFTVPFPKDCSTP